VTRLSGLLRPWALLLCAGGAATVAYHLVREPVFQAVVALGIVVAALVAITVGLRAHRPARRLPWIILAASQAAALGSWIVWEHSILTTGSSPSPGSFEDVFWLTSNLLLLATASFLLVRRQAGIAGLLDAGILSAGIALAAWLFVFSRHVEDVGSVGLSSGTTLTYALLDALMLAVLLRGMPSLRSAPAMLVPAAIVAVLATDSLYNWLAVTGTYTPGAWADLGWLLAPVFLGAAALHPAMVTLFDRTSGHREASPSRPFLGLLLLAALGAPLVMTVELVTGRETDSVIGLACAVALSVLVVVRLALLIRRAERLSVALRIEDERARHLAAIVESSNDAIISMDSKGTILSWNAAAARMYGYEPAEVVGKPITLLVPPERSEDPDLLVERLEAGEEIESYETVSLAKDGRRVQISLSISAIRDVQGKVVGLSTIARDITERRRAEDARQRLAAIAEASSDAIIGTELDGRVVSWNAAAEAVSGWSAAEIVGRNVANVIAAERRDDLPELLARLERGERVISFDTQLACKDGSTAEISLSVALVRDAAGVPSGISAVARDVTATKEADRKLQEAEKRYRSLVEQLPFATYIDSPGGIGSSTYLSPQIEAMTGHAPQEWLDDPELFQKLLHPDDRERVVAEVQRATDAGEPVLQEYRFVARNGETVWVRDSAVMVRDEDGNPAWRQGFVIDITETKGAEGRLREAEARYRTLVEQLPVITYIDIPVDDRGELWRPSYVSPQLTETLGWTTDDWMSRTGFYYDTMVHPEDREWVVAAHERAFASESGHTIEHRLLHRDGSTRWFVDQMVIARDEHGGPLWSQGYLLDITERKASEERIRLAESRYRSLVEQLPLVVYIDALDEDSSAIYMSPQIEAMLGYTVDEWLSDRELFKKLLHEDDRERVLAEIHRTQREELPFTAEYRLVGKDGRVVWVHDEDALIRGEDGLPLYTQGFMLDITNRVEAERELERLLEVERAHNEELRELDGLKDEFVALVSHELRTPLTSIRGYLELVLDGEAGALDEEQARFLRVVERNAIRLQGLVGDLLFIAQVEAGRLAIESAPVDIAEIVDESIEAARPAAGEKQLELAVETDHLAAFCGDRGRLGQLLDNLVSNAVKFTPPGGRVTVRAAEAGGRLELSVADTGIGIPELEQGQLFQRFFRSSTATEQAIPGTGLGLTIAKAIAEAHGGTIRCESAEGVGTTFTVELPFDVDTSLEEAA
jgi:PAS domain S-box-containing protein